YIYGKGVNGAAQVVFGVAKNSEKKKFPSSVQRVMISGGDGVVILTREHITQTFPYVRDLLGNSIFIAVSVITENGDEMVETELRDIKIVTSPYTINFKKTPTFFKPGMIMDVSVEVLHHDNTPAEDVKVVLDPGNIQGVTRSNGITKISITTFKNSGTMNIM
ncbi:hypothetical protein XENOCAPTIV_015950, partial [Xenoophorus captivus]